MKDWLWRILNDYRCRLVEKRRPARRVNRISRICVWLKPC